MPRAMWSGAISFGLVTVPVKVYTAATSKDVRFNQLHETDGSRISMKRVCRADGEEVPFDELVKGYEISPDTYVVINPEELETLQPKGSRRIELEEFIDLAAIDPVFFENSYYLVPDELGSKAYALLRAAMTEAGKVGIGRCVMRNKQYLTAIRPAGSALSMATLYYADEVTNQGELDGLPDMDDADAYSDKELNMAKQLIASLEAEFEPDKYHDEYRDAVLDLIEKKAAGEELVAQPAEAAETKVVDLMAALEASIAKAKGESAKTG